MLQGSVKMKERNRIPGKIISERLFSAELNSNDHIRLKSLNGDNTSIDGSLGELVELELVEGVFLAIQGRNGILCVDLSENELKELLQSENRKVSAK
jgi:hypothetical protein